jgi:Peptidase_C39 like family
MRRNVLYLEIALQLFLLGGAPLLAQQEPAIAPSRTETKLDIDRIEQKTPWFCWLAVGEMVFKYFGLDEPDVGYQWGTIGMIAGPMSPCWYNPALCGNRPAGTSENLERMIRDYPKAVAVFQHKPLPSALQLTSVHTGIDWSAVKDEIDNKRPIVAGINSDGIHHSTPLHVTLIVGYRENPWNGKHLLLANDPFPYEDFNSDPYGDQNATSDEAHQYRIEYSNFKNGMTWDYTIVGIQDPDHHVSVDDLKTHVKYKSAPIQPAATGGVFSHFTAGLGLQGVNYRPIDQELPAIAEDMKDGFAFTRKTINTTTVAIDGIHYGSYDHYCILKAGEHDCYMIFTHTPDGPAAKTDYDAIKEGQLARVDCYRVHVESR